MAKVLTERNIDTISCPGCKANIEIERENPTHRIVEHEHNDELREKLDKIEKMVTDKVDPPKPPKKETVLPSFVPGYVCKDCGDVHKNKNYKKKAPFKCATCGQFSASDKASCPWCGDKDWEELDEDEMSMLPEPVAEAHSHEDDQ